MNNDQYTRLQKYEKPLRQAYYHNYFTQVSTKQIEEIHNIYKEATGDLAPVNYACGECQLRLLQRVGKIYFKYEPTPAIPPEETFIKDEDIEKKQTVWDRMAKARAAKRKNKK